MSTQNIRKDALSASNVFLLSSVTFQGVNKYTLGTDMLVWDESNSYSITQIAPTFGQIIQGGPGTPVTFRCGNAGISVFDFGLLLSCFTAMSMAHLELGTGVPVELVPTSVPGVEAMWFGNHGIIFGLRHNLLVPIASGQAQRACKNEKVDVASFIDSRRFVLKRTETHFALDTAAGEGVCVFSVPTSIKRSFPALFSTVPMEQPTGFGQSLDETSPLGAMIASASVAHSVQEVLAKYKEQTSIDSVVVRSDLICQPTQRYTSAESFLGSLCYTDKHDITLAVNMRSNLFVHRPWFAGKEDGRENDEDIQVTPSPKLSEFYDAREECERIMRYAKTVTVRPLTAAKFDFSVFEAVKAAFFEMRLRRLPLASSLGKIVIPETTLLAGLESTAGENIYCIVPVGALGENVIVINTEGELSVMRNGTWGTDEFFYDITEVVS